MGRKSKLPTEQRREAVLALLRREESAAALARRYGVSEQTLFRWRDDFIAGGESALAGSKSKEATSQQQRIAELEKEIESRDQVIGEYTIANRFLKKLSERSN